MSFADATIERLPGPLRPFAERHHELIKFAIVGPTTFVIDMAAQFLMMFQVGRDEGSGTQWGGTL